MGNDTQYGLAAYFFSKDLKRVWNVASELEYGTFCTATLHSCLVKLPVTCYFAQHDTLQQQQNSLSWVTEVQCTIADMRIYFFAHSLMPATCTLTSALLLLDMHPTRAADSRYDWSQ